MALRRKIVVGYVTLSLVGVHVCGLIVWIFPPVSMEGYLFVVELQSESSYEPPSTEICIIF